MEAGGGLRVAGRDSGTREVEEDETRDAVEEME